MLEIKNITKVFNINTPDEKVALNDLSLSVNDGDFITIIGSNGAGKSTLFNSIAGSFLTDKGSIYLDGKDITFKKEYERSKDIGRIFQDPLLGSASNLSIMENLALPYLSYLHRNPLSILNKKDKEYLKDKCRLLDMDLENRMDTPIGLLSGGQRQAITLLMATIAKPKLLLLDEHTAALDPKTSNKVMEITNKIVKEDNITTLMITHSIDLALHTGNKTIVMNNGKIIEILEGDKRSNMTYKDVLSLYQSHNIDLSDEETLVK